jgi:hypothetical protein
MLEAIGLTKCYASLPAVSQVSFTCPPRRNSGLPGAEWLSQKTTVTMWRPPGHKVLFQYQQTDQPGYKGDPGVCLDAPFLTAQPSLLGNRNFFYQNYRNAGIGPVTS